MDFKVGQYVICIKTQKSFTKSPSIYINEVYKVMDITCDDTFLDFGRGIIDMWNKSSFKILTFELSELERIIYGIE